MAQYSDLQNNPEWKEVKKVVRAVLLSDVKNGIKLKHFIHRYRELYQAPLDYKPFGFKNTLELLRAMPDVARYNTLILYNSHGSPVFRHQSNRYWPSPSGP